MTTRPELLRLGAFLCLAAVGLLAYGGFLLQQQALYDEAIYEAAAVKVRDGESPYGGGRFYYPPVFAFALDNTQVLAGEHAARWLWRWTSFLALLWTVWLAAAWAVGRGRTGARLAIAVLLLLTPAAANALRFGNLSPLVAALVLSGLLAVESRPVAAGLLLGAGFAIKPLTVPALAALGVPSRGIRTREWLRSPAFLASCTGAAASAVLLLALPYWREYLHAPILDLLFHRSASLLRLLDLLSVPLPRSIVVFAVAASFAAVVWRRRARGRERTAWALTATVVGAPLLWNHTFLVFYPVMMLALRTAFERSLEKRRRAPAGTPGLSWWVGLAAVSCLVGAILFFESANLDRLAAWLQILLILPPLAAPVLLTSYVFLPARAEAPGA